MSVGAVNQSQRGSESRDWDLNARTITLAALCLVMALLVVAVARSVMSESAETTTDAPVAAPNVAPELVPPLVLTPASNGRNGAPLALVNGSPMFPLPGSAMLGGWIGAPVEAHDMTVISVENLGFWMGIDETQKVYVDIPAAIVELGALSVENLTVGQMVNVSGRFGELPSNSGSLGLSPDDRLLLDRHDAMVVANSVRNPSG